MFRKSAGAETPQKRLGKILLDDDIISEEQLTKALEQQHANGGFIGQILVDQKAISEDTLISYVAKQLQIPHLSLLNYRISEEALSQVPKELCVKHYLLPVDKMGRILTLAMVDPLDAEALEEVKRHCPDLRIKPVICSWDHFQATMKQLHAHDVKRPEKMGEKHAQAESAPEAAPQSDKTISADTRAASAPAQESPPSEGVDANIQDVAEALQESVSAAVAAAKDSESSQQTDLARIAEDTLESIAQDSGTQEGQLAKIAKALLQSLAAEKSTHAEKQEHLARIAQAALDSVRQTAQLIEAHTVGANNRNDMLRHRQTKHASVAPFLSPAGGAKPVDAPEYLEEDGKVRDALTSERPLETLTFDNFFAGEANAFTVKLAQAVAAKPGGEYNPLFLYGKVGLGKTHLISAIGNANITATGNAKTELPRRIGYISASHFARRLTAAIADNALELFRDNYCHWDMLILDDIQFLGGRVEAQEEFFHIFNVLQQQGRQIIIAGDKAPDRLGMLEQRLVSRFASGIVAELKPPEWETRMKILRYQIERDKAKVSEEVLSLVAMRVPDDIRKMTGALHKIIAFSRLEGDKMTVEDAQKILSHLGVDEAA